MLFSDTYLNEEVKHVEKPYWLWPVKQAIRADDIEYLNGAPCGAGVAGRRCPGNDPISK